MAEKKGKTRVDTYMYEIKSDRAKRWEETRTPEYKKYRKMWIDYPSKFIVGKGPIHLDLEATNECNLACPMCPRTAMIKNKALFNNKPFKVGFMDFDFYKEMIDQAILIDVKSIKLNWLGEPTMHPKIIDMVSYAKEKGILDVIINTNGTYVDEKMAEDFIKAGLDKISFSFDSPYKEDYEKLRLKANYDEVFNNIKRFGEIKDHLKEDVPLTRVCMMLLKMNKNQYDDFVKKFTGIVDVIACGEFSNFQGQLSDKPKRAEKSRLSDFACAQLWQRMFINWDGTATICCGDINGKYVVGDAKKDKLHDIWHSKKYNAIREKHKNGEYLDCEICRNCDIPKYDKVNVDSSN